MEFLNKLLENSGKRGAVGCSDLMWHVQEKHKPPYTSRSLSYREVDRLKATGAEFHLFRVSAKKVASGDEFQKAVQNA